MDKITKESLVITLANLGDLPELEIIESECDRYFSFDPPCKENHSRSLKECIEVGDIPFGGKRDNYHIYCIRHDNIIIGFFAYYLEYENIKDMAYISVIYIKNDYRQKGIGDKIIEIIVNKLKSINIKEIRTHISLRNISSLRFFVKHGFDRIIHIDGDGILYPEKFGGMEISRRVE